MIRIGIFKFLIPCFILFPFHSTSQENQQEKKNDKVDSALTMVEIFPEFPGGNIEMIKFLSDNIRYPAEARDNGIQGTVYISFIVRKDGSITDVIKKPGTQSVGGGCDEEAVRVVKLMPKWKPGMQNGDTVNVAMILPVKFKLADGDESEIKGYYAVKHWFAYNNQITSFDIGNTNTGIDRKLRYSALPNFEFNYNLTIKQYFPLDLFAGLSIKNEGIYFNDSIDHKYSIFSAGIPVYLQFRFTRFWGNCYFMAGGGADFPVYFREKHFYSAGKEKKGGFFSKKTNFIQPYATAGLWFRDYAMIKFTWYFCDLLKQSYEETIGGTTQKPFNGFNSTPWNITLSLFIAEHDYALPLD